MLKNTEKSMEKIIRIEGMMCPHCEARVKKVLEETEGVTEAIVSYKSGTATVKLSSSLPDDVLVKTVTDNGYKVIEITVTK